MTATGAWHRQHAATGGLDWPLCRGWPGLTASVEVSAVRHLGKTVLVAAWSAQPG